MNAVDQVPPMEDREGMGNQMERLEASSPYLSIIIPVYKVEQYLPECLDSLLAQTYAAWEAICVDDGSPDKCGVILDDYARKDARLTIIHQRNAGVSVARNRGLARIHGTHVGFLDSDDAISPQWLSIFARLARETGADLVHLHCTVWLGDKLHIDEPVCTPPFSMIDTKKDVLEWGYGPWLRDGWLFVCLFSVSVLKGARMPLGMRMKEDNIFNLGILPRLRTVCQSDFSGYLYRNRSTSAVNVPRSVEDSVRFLRECERAFTLQLPMLGQYACRKACAKSLSRFLAADVIGWALRKKAGERDAHVRVWHVYREVCKTIVGNRVGCPPQARWWPGLLWYAWTGCDGLLRLTWLLTVWRVKVRDWWRHFLHSGLQ